MFESITRMVYSTLPPPSISAQLGPETVSFYPAGTTGSVISCLPMYVSHSMPRSYTWMVARVTLSSTITTYPRLSAARNVG